jgi:uncharacterized damage-inducible protein DinB
VTDRGRPPLAAGETETVLAFLDLHRATLLRKSADLTPAQLDQRLEPSTMTLGGLVTHLAWVESWWFVETFLGAPAAEPWASLDFDADRDAEWHLAPSLTPDQQRELFEREVGRAREIVAAAPDLDAVAVRRSRHGEPVSLRWIVIHMIEEYARHNGHADLIRESIDGSVGT